MITLAAFVSELAPLLEQLEKAVASGDSASGGQLFEWRIRARIIQEKLHQAAKPPVVRNPDEDVEEAAPLFSLKTMGKAQIALRHAVGLREALHNRHLKVALEAARTIDRLMA